MNLFSPPGTWKYWLKKSSPVFWYKLSLVCIILTIFIISNIYLAYISYFWSWIRWFVLSWWNTSKYVSLASIRWKGTWCPDGGSDWYESLFCLGFCMFLDWLCTLLPHRVSLKGSVVKKMQMLNKRLVHLVDDFFFLGFKEAVQAEKVFKFIIFIIYIRLLMFINFINLF